MPQDINCPKCDVGVELMRDNKHYICPVCGAYWTMHSPKYFSMDRATYVPPKHTPSRR